MNSPLFEVDPHLAIGKITEVSGSALKIELDGAISELTRTHRGNVYPIGQFGSVVKIHYGRTILFALVRLLRMKSEETREEGHPIPAGFVDARVLEADLFAEGTVIGAKHRFEVTRGVRQYPLPGQSVHLTTRDELRHLYEAVQERYKSDRIRTMRLGSHANANTTECRVDIDKLCGLHSAVLGSTGSGKSATVAAVLHGILESKARGTSASGNLRPRVILIDPHGEYASAFANQARVFRAHSTIEEHQTPTSLIRLPYWLLSSDEFRDLIVGKSEFGATTENNIVLRALTHARLRHRGWIEGAKDWEGQLVADGPQDPAIPRPLKKEFEVRVREYDWDTPDPFCLDEFEKHIRQEQGIREKAKAWSPMSTSEFKSHASVLRKLNVLRTDKRLSFMMDNFEPGKEDLVQILEQLFGSVSKDQLGDIRVIDISGVPNEVAGALTAAIARLLFQFKSRETRTERESNPILLVCEEAHRYVPNEGYAEYAAAQDAIRRIAKEGRKYGLGLMLVSQRPADVERTVLSQCNTWIIMRLTNTTDQEYVAKFLPDSLAGFSRLLPSLTRQEALVVGEAVALPSRIRIRDLTKKQLPDSHDVSFVDGWSKPPMSTEEIKVVVDRWRREDKPNSTEANSTEANSTSDK